MISTPSAISLLSVQLFFFVRNFTALDILLGISNYDNNNNVTILNFVILLANNYIYNCEKSGKPIDITSK